MREFTMGARINMSDGFSDPVSRMSRTAQQFGDAARHGSHDVDAMGRSAMASTGGLGAFTAGSRAANMSARGMAGGVASLTASLLGLNSILGIVMGLMTFKVAYDWLVQSNAEMEQYENTLTVVLGSSEKAKDTLEWATKFAAQTPFEIPQVVEATTKLELYGITAQKTLGTIGDMASVMGKPLMQAVEAVADAQTGEVERLKEFGITKDMLIKQSEKMGTTAVDNKGTITDQVAFNAALFTLMEDRYKGGMEMQSKSFKGMISNAADFMGTMGREFGKPIFERLKLGLSNVLGFLDGIKEDGTMEALTIKAQAFGLSVTEVFGSAFSYMGDVIGAVSSKVRAFLDNNGPRFALIGGVLSEAFTTLQAYAMPVLTWITETGLPGLLTGLSAVGTFVLQVAEFFITNWQPIAPFVEGMAIAFGLVAGPIYTIVGAMYLVAQATKAWAVAQGILNAVMMVNPVYLMIAGIGLLIGAGLWLVQNWELVKTTAAGLWDSVTNYMSIVATKFMDFAKIAATAIVTVLYFVNPFVYLAVKIAQNWGTLGPIFAGVWASITQPVRDVVTAITSSFSAAWNYLINLGNGIGNFFATTWNYVVAGIYSMLGPAVPAVASIGEGITSYFGGLIDQAFTWGSNIIDTMLTGVLSAKDRLVGAFMDVFGEVRQLMPFSDAKEGPFSQLTYSGGAIMSTMADGVTGNAGTLHGAMTTAFSQAPDMAADFSASGAIAGGGAIPISAAATQQTAGVGGNTIGTLIGELTISGVEKNAKELADEIIDILHERLSAANDIAGADMGALL